ncbi:hypothetical protein J6590_043112 [Homalodisca vitripennis]|nr:hypothetical protein J6590_043112 [Homalodisca vitripennis]
MKVLHPFERRNIAVSDPVLYARNARIAVSDFCNSDFYGGCKVSASVAFRIGRYADEPSPTHPSPFIQSHRPIPYATISSTRRGPKQMVLKHSPKPLPTTNTSDMIREIIPESTSRDCD